MSNRVIQGKSLELVLGLLLLLLVLLMVKGLIQKVGPKPRHHLSLVRIESFAHADDQYEILQLRERECVCVRVHICPLFGRNINTYTYDDIGISAAKHLMVPYQKIDLIA